MTDKNNPQPKPDIETLVSRMHKLKHFASLEPSEIKQMISIGIIHRYTQGSTVFREDETCAGLFVLLSGQVYLYKFGPGGQENIMAVVNPVIMFNEVAVLDRGANPVSAVTTQDSYIWQVGCETFNQLIREKPLMGLGLLPVLAQRNRFMISQYEDLSFRPVKARMAKLLLDLSQQGKHPINRSEHSISKMAARISTVPEAVSRSLRDFNNKALICSTRSNIEILDIEGLSKQAQIGLELF